MGDNGGNGLYKSANILKVIELHTENTENGKFIMSMSPQCFHKFEKLHYNHTERHK